MMFKGVCACGGKSGPILPKKRKRLRANPVARRGRLETGFLYDARIAWIPFGGFAPKHGLIGRQVPRNVYKPEPGEREDSPQR